ncbi:MAG: 30S ribosome-binding factor RbfA [Ardenticatenales bacterium]
MVTLRQRRINDRLAEELSLLIPGASEDERLTDVRITHVETTQDLATAKVYFTAMDTPASELGAITEALQAAEFGLRAELADVGLRRLPRLVFAFDKEYAKGARVLDILEQLEHAPDESAAPTEGSDPQ